MIFNFCKSLQFQTRIQIDQSLLEQVHQMKLLGVIISDDLTWHKNTDYLVKRAYMRMTILRKLYEFKVNTEDLVLIYILYIRSLVEQNCVVWSSSITKEEIDSIERVQKIALRLIFRENYGSYTHALQLSGLPTLCDRRYQLSLSFALKTAQNSKTNHMFPQNPVSKTRHSEKYLVPHAYTERYKKSAIPFMARQMNIEE